MRRVLTLVLLATSAVIAAGVLAYGTDPYWGRFSRGLGLITFAHRMQWLLIIVALIGSLGLVGMVIAAKTRAWWLIALGPVLALFVHRFAASPMRHFAIAEEPPVVLARDAAFMKDEDFVVGLVFERQAYAFPYAGLFQTPVVVQERHDQRFILMWSPYANRAVAYTVDNPFKTRDLQIVSMPADALLVYNRKIGQFINGLRGQTLAGQKPTGYLQPLETQKMTWGRWKDQYPKTVVMKVDAGGPSMPLAPRYPVPVAKGAAASPTGSLVFIPTTQPVAVNASDVGVEPVSVSAGQTQLVLFRDTPDGRVIAFDRRVNEDLFPVLQRKTDPKHPEVAFVDRDSGSGWTAGGKAVEGPLKGEQMRRVGVDDGVYWGVMKYWYPDLLSVEATKPPPGLPSFNNPTDPKPRRRRR